MSESLQPGQQPNIPAWQSGQSSGLWPLLLYSLSLHGPRMEQDDNLLSFLHSTNVIFGCKGRHKGRL